MLIRVYARGNGIVAGVSREPSPSHASMSLASLSSWASLISLAASLGPTPASSGQLGGRNLCMTTTEVVVEPMGLENVLHYFIFKA